VKLVYRVVEDQASLNSYRATQDEETAVQLEILIELTKPRRQFNEWHNLVATPFRYPLPVNSPYQARFRPPFFQKNVFYAAGILETSLYEYSYHFMRQRVHLMVKKKRKKNETGTRTGFSVNTDDTGFVDIRNHPNITAIMDKGDYTGSHQFIKDNALDYLIYPSARDPLHRDSIAIFDVHKIEKNPATEHVLNFFYDYGKKEVLWLREDLRVEWSVVS